jgi:outer membrane protein TolC
LPSRNWLIINKRSSAATFQYTFQSQLDIQLTKKILRIFTRYFILFLLVFSWLLIAKTKVLGAGREVRVPDIQFQPVLLTRAVTIRQAVDIALRNYPAIAQKIYRLRAAKANVTLAKMQYLPNLNVDIQESAVTPNTVASVVMNNVSGFDTVPVDAGPSVSHRTMKPDGNNLQGLNFNWLLVDQGLRHANDNFAYADARTARTDVSLTKLDVALATADAFLDAVSRKQAIISTTSELQHMEAADLRAKTLVGQGLKAGVETADWDYKVAEIRIALIEAERDARLALVDLAEKMGIATQDIEVISTPLIASPTNLPPFAATDLTSHPLALLKTAEIGRWQAKQVVLDKAYRPHLWLNASAWGKGSNNSANSFKSYAGGTLPQVFNYMVGLTYSFPILEYFPLKAQKEQAHANELAARADFDLAMQVLEKKDSRARILLAESKKIAEQTPILVEAARVREINVEKRYSVGLANMVALADAEKALAVAQVKNAQAQVEVWRSVLHLAYVQGDLTPFLRIVAIAEGDTALTNGGK